MIALLLLACTEAPSLCDAPVEGGLVSLPADDAFHDAPIEWWYWTGHLQAEDGRWFGFEHVFFAADYQGQSGQMSHVALTDVDAARFRKGISYSLADPEVLDGGYALEVLDQTATGGDGHDVLHAEADGFVLDLVVDAVKAPVLQHGDGRHDYDFGGYTFYYSRPRMTAEGALVIDGETVPVTGTAWFDHQWGELDAAIETGWDWFALQLDDGREVMLFVVRPESGDELVGGTVTGADCASTEIDPADFAITPRGSWTSPHTGCTYPLGWDVRVGEETFTVTPVLEDQELPDAWPKYWEGAATVSGAATGRAYVELTGYCAG